MPSFDLSRRSIAQTATLIFCFFLSGATSLVLETAWSKQLSYILGVDLFGTATTVVAYMCGLGLGAYLAARFSQRLCSRPLRAYALVQVFIGGAGLLSVPMLRATAPLFSLLYQFDHSPVLFIALRFLVTLGLLLPATTLMGMTLPLVLGARTRMVHGATSAGLLYGVNTLGAVAGAMVAGFLLVPRWGLLGTCIGAGIVDLCIAVLVGLLSLFSESILSSEEERVETSHPAALQPQEVGWARDVLIVLLIGGMSALGLELAWFRLFVQVAGPTVTAFSVTLGVFLAGIGLGSALFGPWVKLLPSGRTALVLCLVWTTTGAIVPAYFLNEIPLWYIELWKAWGSDGADFDLLRTQCAIASFIVLPATLGMGATFPAGVRAYEESLPRDGEADLARAGNHRVRLSVISARLFYFNTIGAVLGAVIWAFFVLPRSGAGGGIKLAAAVAVVALLVATWGSKTKARKVSPWNYLAPAALFSALLFMPKVDPRTQNAGLFSAVRGPDARGKVDVKPLRKEATLLFSKEGYNASVAVIKNRYGRNSIDISYSGKWVASTHPASVRHLVLLGQLPMILAPEPPKTALVIGLGSGITSGSVLRHGSLDHLDIVEIEPAVPEASSYFNSISGAPLSDPRVQLILQDGRTHLAFGRKQYDVITSDPIHPWVKGAANLYSKEFYQAAHARLNQGGVFCQWIPSSMSQHSFNSIAKTMRSIFPDVKLLFSGGEAIALASKGEVSFTSARIDQALGDERVRAELRRHRIGETERLVKFLSARLKRVPEGDSLNGVINTDDNVFLEHALPWEMFHGDRARDRGFAKLQ